MRIVSTETGKNHLGQVRIVRVKYNHALNEYVCEVTDNGKRKPSVDYFTNDESDAYATARLMIGERP